MVNSSMKISTQQQVLY